MNTFTFKFQTAEDGLMAGVGQNWTPMMGQFSMPINIPLLNLDVIPLPSSKEIAKLSGATTQKDIPVLASAINGKSDYLVTGDKDFRQVTGQYSFKILSPSEFLDNILPEVLKALESE